MKTITFYRQNFDFDDWKELCVKAGIETVYYDDIESITIKFELDKIVF